jgi:hypothetical protein
VQKVSENQIITLIKINLVKKAISEFLKHKIKYQTKKYDFKKTFYLKASLKDELYQKRCIYKGSHDVLVELKIATSLDFCSNYSGDCYY